MRKSDVAFLSFACAKDNLSPNSWMELHGDEMKGHIYFHVGEVHPQEAKDVCSTEEELTLRTKSK